MEKIIMLEATTGTVAVIAFLIYYTRRLKNKLRRHTLRNEEVQKYLQER